MTIIGVSVILYNVVTYGYDVNKYISIKFCLLHREKKWLSRTVGLFGCLIIKYLVFALEIKLGLLNEVKF